MPKRWEYKVEMFSLLVNPPYGPEDDFNALGEEGWELVAVHGRSYTFYYFKREKMEEPSER